MKRLFVIGLCLAVVLAAPTPDDDDHHDLDDNRPQQPRAQRRLQQHHQIDDDDDDDDLQQHHRRWLQNHQHQIDNDDDDDDDQRRQQQQQIRRRLQELSLKFIDDRDDDNRLRADVNRHNLRPDDDRNDEQLRKTDDNSNLDVLAKELDNLAAKYNGRGVLKVGYNPPLVRNVIKKFKEFNESMIDNQLKHYVLQSPGARAHNLGFTPSEVASRVHHHKDLVPVPSIKANNGYVLLRGLDRQDLRARDDDDDDDDDQL